MIKYYNVMILELRIKITNYVLYVIGIFLSISIVVGVVLFLLYSNHKIESFPIRLIIFVIFWWGYYLWFSRSKVTESPIFFQNIFALFGLVLMIVLGVSLQMNPYNEWVFLLLYPFIIFYLLEKKYFLMWILFYVIAFNLYIVFENLEHFDQDLHVPIFFTVNFYLVCACVLGWIGSQTIEQIITQSSTYRFRRHRERMFQILNTFVPLIEQRHSIPREEIYQTSNLMKELSSNYSQYNYRNWEIDLLSLVSYVSRIAISDYLIEKKFPIQHSEAEIISTIRYFGYDILSDLEQFKRIRTAILYTLPTEQKSKRSEKDEDEFVLSEILMIVEDYIELTGKRRYKKDELTNEEALNHLRNFVSLRYRSEIYNEFRGIILKDGNGNHPLD